MVSTVTSQQEGSGCRPADRLGHFCVESACLNCVFKGFSAVVPAPSRSPSLDEMQTRAAQLKKKKSNCVKNPIAIIWTDIAIMIRFGWKGK